MKTLPENSKRIMFMTGITESQLNTMIFDQGIEYLRREAGYDEWGIKVISCCSMYWAWWKNLWYNRDIQFLQSLGNINTENLTERGKRNLFLEYQVAHDLKNIDQYPGSIIMQQAYENIITEIIKINTNGNKL